MSERPVYKATVRKARGYMCRVECCRHNHAFWDVWYWRHWSNGQVDVAGRDWFNDWDTAIQYVVGTLKVSNRAD